MVKTCAPLLVACLIAVGCIDEPRRDNTLDRETITSSECANESRVVNDEERVASLSGDVDGDGSEDTIYLVADEQAEPRCRSFLVIDTGARSMSAAVDPSGAARALASPSLRLTAPINDAPGDEIVVNIESGASTEFVGIFTATSEGLARVEVEGKPPGPFAQELTRDALFPFGGSVGHMEAVDCAQEDGFVVLSAAIPSGSAAMVYDVERRFFRAEGATLTLVPELTEKREMRNHDVHDLPEFASSPFGSCD